MVLCQLSNHEEMVYYGNIHTSCLTYKHQSRDHAMAATERAMLNLLLKNVKYINCGACLGSINHGYGQPYMYFIILGGESVSTNKIGCSDTVTLNDQLYILYAYIYPPVCSMWVPWLYFEIGCSSITIINNNDKTYNAPISQNCSEALHDKNTH